MCLDSKGVVEGSRNGWTEHIGRLTDNKAAGTDGLGSSFIKQLIGVIELRWS